MKSIVVEFFVISAVFLAVLALFRAEPATAKIGGNASVTLPNQSAIAPNTGRTGKNAEDEDCMSEDDPTGYPVSVTVDRAGNPVPLATTATPVSDKPDLV